MGEKKRKDEVTDKDYDKELKDTFPASDPPSASQPGGGITGTEPPPKSGQQAAQKSTK